MNTIDSSGVILALLKYVDSSFANFLRQFEEGIRGFINGDSSVWKQNLSRGEGATIMGAWGAYEKGWSEVEPRYDWAAACFTASGAQPKIEYLAAGVSGDLAYTVSIERSEVRLTDQGNPTPMQLRATHVFQRENGIWKLLHRHADPIVGKTAPSAVLER